MFQVAHKADCTRTPPEKNETHATALLPAPYDRSIAYCDQCVVLAGLRRTARSHKKNSVTVLLVPRWRERRWPWPEVWRHPRRHFSCTFTPSEAFDVAGVIAFVPALVIAFTYRCRLLVATLARASCFKRILPLGASPRGGVRRKQLPRARVDIESLRLYVRPATNAHSCRSFTQGCFHSHLGVSRGGPCGVAGPPSISCQCSGSPSHVLDAPLRGAPNIAGSPDQW